MIFPHLAFVSHLRIRRTFDDHEAVGFEKFRRRRGTFNSAL